MKNIAIIPARSGSKGLKDKNIKLLNGKPLIAYSINAAIESELFDEVMVSTDSEEYAEIARKYQANVPFLRSARTSSDTASSWDMVCEVLNNYYQLGYEFDTVCLLQPTSPLRTGEDIVKAYQFFSDKDASTVTSVCEVDHSPEWCMVLPEDCSLTEYNKKSEDAPRQQLKTYHRFNGAIYIKKISYESGSAVLGTEPEYAFIMERSKSIDIDVELDFMIAESLMKYVK